MAIGETAKLLASLELNASKFTKGTNDALGSLGKLEGGVTQKLGKIGKAAAIGLVGVATAATAVVAGAIKSGLTSLEELSRVTAQTNAVIESTAGKAGVSAAKVRELAESLENVTTADDKVIQSGENMLLTFTNIGSDIFPQATKAMLDMAIAMNNGSVEGLDLKTTAVQLGKALQDPVKGVTALRKVGVALTEDQQKQVKALVETGDRVAALGQLNIKLTDAQKKALAAGKSYAQAGVRLTKDQQKRVDALAKEIGLQEAQKIILGELETEFGKAGEAAGKDFGSAVRRLKDVWEDLTIVLARASLPVITRVADLLRTKLGDPKFLATVEDFGKQLAGAFDKLLDFAQKMPWDSIGSGLKTAAEWSGRLFDAFRSLPPEVQTTLVALTGLNKLSGGAISSIVSELGKGLIKGVLGMNAAVVNINAAQVNGGRTPSIPTPGTPAGSTGISALGKVLLIGEAITLLTAIAATNSEIAGNTKQHSAELSSQVDRWLRENKLTPAELQAGLSANQAAQAQLKSDPVALFFNASGAKDALEGLQRDEAKIKEAIHQQDLAQQAAAALQRSNDMIARAANQAGYASIVSAIKSQPAPVVNVSLNASLSVSSFQSAGYTSDRYSSTKTVVRAI